MALDSGELLCSGELPKFSTIIHLNQVPLPCCATRNLNARRIRIMKLKLRRHGSLSELAALNLPPALCFAGGG